MNELWPWLTLALLGAYHGVNPAMGWLFAVALGLQERNRSAVLRAFLPIALGHAAAIAAVVALVGFAQALVDLTTLRLVGAGALVLFGLYKLLAPMSHPRWVGMRVNFRDLTTWSFLMATAHGAGLMLVPLLLRLPRGVAHTTHDLASHAGHAAHMQMAGAVAAPTAEFAAVALHTAAMFLVMAVVAMVVFEKVGLAVLRRAWINLDLVWAVALIASGVVAFVV
jgi:hypothetical protein